MIHYGLFAYGLNLVDGAYLRILHLDWAAFRAISDRCSFVSLTARAAPPLRPSSTAALFLPSA